MRPIRWDNRSPREQGITRGYTMEDRHRNPRAIRGLRQQLRVIIKRLNLRNEGPRLKFGVDWHRFYRGWLVEVRQGENVKVPATFEGKPVRILYRTSGVL